MSDGAQPTPMKEPAARRGEKAESMAQVGEGAGGEQRRRRAASGEGHAGRPAAETKTHGRRDDYGAEFAVDWELSRQRGGRRRTELRTGGGSMDEAVAAAARDRR